MTTLAVFAGLFLTAFAAATLLPVQSEAVLAGLLLKSPYPIWQLIAVASLGNVLGSTVNWALGRAIEHFHNRRWFPIGPQALERAQRWYQKYGKWSLLMSWAPLIGDPLTLAAGVLREPLPVFLVLVAIAKVVRYLVVAAIVLNW